MLSIPSALLRFGWSFVILSAPQDQGFGWIQDPVALEGIPAFLCDRNP